MPVLKSGDDRKTTERRAVFSSGGVTRPSFEKTSTPETQPAHPARQDISRGLGSRILF